MLEGTERESGDSAVKAILLPWFVSPIEGRVTTKQYKVVLKNPFYPMMKHFYSMTLSTKHDGSLSVKMK